MNKKVIFLMGFVVGIVANQLTEKRKKSKRIDELTSEIDKNLENIERTMNDLNDTLDGLEKSTDNLNTRKSKLTEEAIEIMNKMGYARTSMEEFNHVTPYLITENEFAEFDDYEAISLTYFADGVLTDEDYEIIHDPEYLVGSFKDWLENEDVIYIRCDERCADYEIAKDIRTYAEVYNTIPHMKWRQNE